MALNPSDWFDRGAIDRRVYADPDIFELERERIFKRVWHYVAHDSEVRAPGQFVTREILGQPILVARAADGQVRAFLNRCSHRGAVLTQEACGTAERWTCSYHAWSFGVTGRLEGVPLREAYADTDVADRRERYDLTPVRLASWHGFLFANLDPQAPDLQTWLGPAAANLTNMVERSPLGQLEPIGVLRMTQRNNWKIYLENLHDGAHALPTHRSSIEAAREAAEQAASPWSRLTANIVAANSQSPRKMAALSVNCFERGHSEMMAFRETPPDFEGQREYELSLRDAYGTERARQILGVDRHIAIFYPNLSITPSYLQLRLIVPLAVDRTRIEAWSFRLLGVPESINRRTVAFANAINSAASLVRADDLENFERVQTGLRAEGARWVSAHRAQAAEPEPVGPSHGMSERFIRNQFHAWRSYMEGP